MNRFDEAMRQALRREEAPEGFAERVLARVEAEEIPAAAPPRRALSRWDKLFGGFRTSGLRWATAAAMIVAVFGGLEYRNIRQEREQGERAKHQVMLALRIAGSKLRHAEIKVQQFGDVPVTQ